MLKFLNSLKNHLKPEGMLFLEVPNVDEALLTFYDIPEFKDYQYQLPHNWYFNKDTIEELLKKCGFGLNEILNIQRYGLANHLGWLTERKPLGNNNKYQILITEEMDLDYSITLSNQDMSDNLFIVSSRR